MLKNGGANVSSAQWRTLLPSMGIPHSRFFRSPASEEDEAPSAGAWKYKSTALTMKKPAPEQAMAA